MGGSIVYGQGQAAKGQNKPKGKKDYKGQVECAPKEIDISITYMNTTNSSTVNNDTDANSTLPITILLQAETIDFDESYSFFFKASISALAFVASLLV